MLDSLLYQAETIPICKEGDLFKKIHAFGKVFHIYYGYYDEVDRINPLVDPMPIYPNFLEKPIYTQEGNPFVTKMQDACKHYLGRSTENRDCAECEHYVHGDELLGICSCSHNKQNE